MSKVYKSRGVRELFSEGHVREQLLALGNPLAVLDEAIDFELFRATLTQKLYRHNRIQSGARPFDPVLLFKLLIIQNLHQLSDHQLEFQLLDRFSFRDFLGLSSGDKIPDQKTIWSFRNKLSTLGIVEDLFACFQGHLKAAGLMAQQGKIIDASITEVPKQHNSQEENKRIKAGDGEDLWKDKPHKKSHKDIDARWTKKHRQSFYGYKNHIKVDAGSKLIDDYEVTDASVHDSQVLESLLDKRDDKGQTLHADSAYVGKEQAKSIRRAKMKNRVVVKKPKGKSLSQRQMNANRKKSKVRARVEHVFGLMHQMTHGGLSLRCVGIKRAKATIGLANLTYNLCRFEYLMRSQMTHQHS